MKEMKQFGKKEMGMEKFMNDEVAVAVIREKEQMKVMPVPENDGQAMASMKHMGAKKAWKPMGRK